MKSFIPQLWVLLPFMGLFDNIVTSASWSLENMGCFYLDYALSMNYHRHVPDISLDKCVTLCGNKHTKYAGIEQSDRFCYCGGDIAEASLRRNDSLCNVPCLDNSTMMCGGDWLMSVYKISDLDDSSGMPITTLPPEGQGQGLGFLVGLSVGVTLHNYSALTTNNTIMSTLDWVLSVDYHLSKNLAFAFVKRRIYKSTLKQKGRFFFTNNQIVRAVSKCDGFAVDWENDRIYWADCDSKAMAVMSCDLAGNSVSLVMMRPGEPVNVKNMIVDPYEKILFWTGDGVIESCTFSGSSFKTNMTSSESVVRSLTLDLTTRRLYFTSADNQSSALYSMDYAGSDVHEHFRVAQLKNVYGLGVFRGYVYWINFAISRDIIYQAPLNFTDFDQVKMLTTIDKAVWHMKLVHPELQTRPSPDACGTKGCSHGCIVASSGAAHCLCPQGFQLDNKGTTCISLFKKSVTSASRSLENMGCFDLSYALSMSYHRHVPDITLNKCVTLCGYRQTKYAGIEQSDNFCYCGSDIVEASLRRNDSLCNEPCLDYNMMMCGGEWLMSVYKISNFNTDDFSGPMPTTTLAPKGQGPGLGFLVGLNVGVTLHNYSALNTSDIIMSTLDWVLSVDYHLSKNLAFAFVKKSIYKSTLGHKVSFLSANPVIVRAVSKCDGFAVDWENDRIYWADCDSKTMAIMSCDLAGNNVSLVMMRPGQSVNVKNMIVDPYEKMLFWTGDGGIESCTFSGSSFKTNMTSSESVVRSLTLDLTTRRLYFTSVDNQSSALYSMDYAGSDVHEHFRLGQLKSVYGLGVFRGYVYWINFASSRDIIYQAPLNFTDFYQVKMLTTIDKSVWHMKLVHPELQTRPAPDACGTKGCSHDCVVASGAARCLCPQGFQLDNKGTTCIDSTQYNQTQVKPDWSGASSNGRSAASQAIVRSRTEHSKVLLVMCLVVATVVLVLGLLYLGNHHWSNIQAKLLGVPYVRQEQPNQSTVSPQYDITEDNVNLI